MSMNNTLIFKLKVPSEPCLFGCPRMTRTWPFTQGQLGLYHSDLGQRGRGGELIAIEPTLIIRTFEVSAGAPGRG